MGVDSGKEAIIEAVRRRYAGAAQQVQGARQASCCSDSSCCGSTDIPFYDLSQIEEIPTEAALASLGCGNPTLLAELKPGEVVLDLGSGGGIDVLLSAKRVGPTGKAYGLDMTDEMLDLAKANARRAGVTNAEFLKGRIEAIPLPDNSIDVIISNCVINLSADKDAVLAEAHRVLKQGGRFAVADVVVRGQPMGEPLRGMLGLWTSCISGAMTEDEYRTKLVRTGFGDVILGTIKEYTSDDLPEALGRVVPLDVLLGPNSRIISAFVKANKK